MLGKLPFLAHMQHGPPTLLPAPEDKPSKGKAKTDLRQRGHFFRQPGGPPVCAKAGVEGGLQRVEVAHVAHGVADLLRGQGAHPPV